MSIKIDAPRVWLYRRKDGSVTGDSEVVSFDTPTEYLRAVRESDWRKIMAVVRDASDMDQAGGLADLRHSVRALRKHLEKRK